MPRKTRATFYEDLKADLASMRPRPDAAENVHDHGDQRGGAGCFNEAAARCRGKPGDDGVSPAWQDASMRPRPDAAENSIQQAEGYWRRMASMRPRPDAAENVDGGGGDRAAAVASMRPRPDAAENYNDMADDLVAQLASMRPRPDAAENPP